MISLKKTVDGQDLFVKFQEDVRQQVIKDCDDALIEIADKTSIPFESVIPRLSKEDFDKLKDETKKMRKVKNRNPISQVLAGGKKHIGILNTQQKNT